MVTFGAVGVPAEDVNLVPSSPIVLGYLNDSGGMELNATDFEDPFAFDATTLSKDDMQLRLYVCPFLSTGCPVFPLTYADSFSAV